MSEIDEKLTKNQLKTDPDQVSILVEMIQKMKKEQNEFNMEMMRTLLIIQQKVTRGMAEIKEKQEMMTSQIEENEKVKNLRTEFEKLQLETDIEEEPNANNSINLSNEQEKLNMMEMMGILKDEMAGIRKEQNEMRLEMNSSMREFKEDQKVMSQRIIADQHGFNIGIVENLRGIAEIREQITEIEKRQNDIGQEMNSTISNSTNSLMKEMKKELKNQEIDITKCLKTVRNEIDDLREEFVDGISKIRRIYDDQEEDLFRELRKIRDDISFSRRFLKTDNIKIHHDLYELIDGKRKKLEDYGPRKKAKRMH